MKTWGAFLLVVVAVVAGLDAVTLKFRTRLEVFDMGRWSFPQWLETKEQYRKRADPTPPSLLFLGDSSIAYGVRPNLVDRRAFSFARQALRTCELDELDLKLQRLLNGRPNAIVIGLLWFACMDLDQENGGPIQPQPYLTQLASHFYDRPQLGQQLLPGARLARLVVDARLERLRTRRRNFFIVAPDGSVETLNDHPSSWSVAQPGQFAETKAGWFTPEHLGHLRSFIQRWRAHGVPVYFVFMPLHPGFREVYDRKLGVDHRRWRAAITKLLEGHVIDMEDDFQDPRYFSDAMHLNREGAAGFSIMLREKMRRIPLGFSLEPAQPNSAPAPLRGVP